MELTKEQSLKINNVGKKYNLKLMLLHGSYATGKQKVGSDIDIAILGKNPVDFDKSLKIYQSSRIFLATAQKENWISNHCTGLILYSATRWLNALSYFMEKCRITTSFVLMHSGFITMPRICLN